MSASNATIEIVKKYFPAPPMEELLPEVNKQFPLFAFGVSGGFGATRGALRRAVRDGDAGEAERLYHQLIAEGAESDIKDTELWQGPCPYSMDELVAEMTKYVDNMGRDLPAAA